MSEPIEALPGGLRAASRILILSGILHGLTWLLEGAGVDALPFVVIGVAYVLSGAGLAGGIRKFRYLAFLIVLIGLVGDTIAMADPVSLWLPVVMLLLDLAALLLLAASIWRGRQLA